MSKSHEFTIVRKNEDDDNVIIKCPSCYFSKSYPVHKLQAFKHTISVKCKCGNPFSAKLEFRKRFRQKTLLNGLYCDLALVGSDKWKIYLHDLTRTNCHIVDISVNGLGIVFHTRHAVSKGDKLRIRFELDTSTSPKIELDIVARYIKDNLIGCEFLDSNIVDKEIRFYLL